MTPEQADRATRKKIRDMEKRIADLRALVDTLQTALRRADTALANHPEHKYVFAQSAKWAMNEKL
jgi:tetrahydromethanopterin S-methyltransferase subunit B